MGKQKLYRYAAVGTFPNVVELDARYRGRWAEDFFGNSNPVVLELACGKGSYTLELARRNPDRNYIGVDIKGERIYVGAKAAAEEGIPNAAFLRTQIDFLSAYFAPGEVSEIWITFPDPYLRKPEKRLTSPRFLGIYRQVVASGAPVHLKTDDPLLHEYTLVTLDQLGIGLDLHVPDVYAAEDASPELFIQTYYEKKHLADGRTIRYVRFTLDPLEDNIMERPADSSHHDPSSSEPADEFVKAENELQSRLHSLASHQALPRGGLSNEPSLADMRQEYTKDGLQESQAADDPVVQFRLWFDQAVASGHGEPNAMTLATADAQGQPSARIVLLKGFDEDGFVFFTNYESRKGEDLEANPKAALLFFWPFLERQVRIEGTVYKISREASKDYFDSRPAGSRIGAWSSHQSRVIEGREVLQKAYADHVAEFGEGPIPLPEYWGGYVVRPHEMEFWQGRPSRLHDRLRYRLGGEGRWVRERLSP